MMSKGMFSAVVASAALLSFVGPARANLIISEVVDGTRDGGNPKFVEITNTGATDFTFTGGGIVLQSNSATDLNIDVDLTGVIITAGDSYVIQSTGNDGQAVFEDTYGFAADLYTSVFFSNGDDRYILADADDGGGVATNLVDIHGEIDTDGTGEAWEYTDGYAYRLPAITSGNGGVFAIGEWFQSGVDALEAGGDDAAEKALLLSLTTPGTHNYVPEPASLALISLGGLAMLRRRQA